MKKVTIYTTNYCPYCVRAKQLLTSLNIAYTEVDVTEDSAARDAASAKAGGYMTVPMIFIGEEFIGGYDDLAKLHATGGLLSKVEE